MFDLVAKREFGRMECKHLLFYLRMNTIVNFLKQKGTHESFHYVNYLMINLIFIYNADLVISNPRYFEIFVVSPESSKYRGSTVFVSIMIKKCMLHLIVIQFSDF